MEQWILEADIYRLQTSLPAERDEEKRVVLQKLLDKKRHWLRVERDRTSNGDYAVPRRSNV